MDITTIKELSLGNQVDAILRYGKDSFSMIEGAMIVASTLSEMIIANEKIITAVRKDEATQMCCPDIICLYEDNEGYIFVFSAQERLEALPNEIRKNTRFADVDIGCVISTLLIGANDLRGIAINPFSNSEGIFVVDKQIATAAIYMAGEKSCSNAASTCD